ncbi:MAG: F0F1 ATP synthase subunit B [Pirellulaceae bacterium]|nr:F0F1 ATP synthase subunit B [Pirellulaceae bacterium]
MMQSLSRITLFAALSMFVLCPVLPAAAQETDAAATATDDKPADGDHTNADHEHAEAGHDHDGGDHDAEHHDAEHHDAEHAVTGDHAGADHGDDHAEHRMPPLLSFDIGSAVCNIAIFLGVLAILSKFVWPAILGGLTAREEKINSDLEGAEQANLEAKGLLASYQTKLDEAASQVQAMLAEARRDAEASGQRIIDEAKSEAQRQSERAIADIETAKKVALSDIAGQTSDMAIMVAKQVVGRELKADDHAELIRQSLERLPSKN